MKLNILSTLALAALLGLTAADAQVPTLFNYQGRVSIGGSNYTGTGQFKFALVNGDASTTYWNNSGATNSSEPSTAVSLVVTQGLYSVLVGDTSVSNMAAIPESVFTNNDLNLRVWFSPGTNGTFFPFEEDQRIGSSGYAVRAGGILNAGATGLGSFVGGGISNVATNDYTTATAGIGNSAGGYAGTIAGGISNTIGGTVSVVGYTNNSKWATIGGGIGNVASGDRSTIAGGEGNTALGNNSTIGGGFSNKVEGFGSTVPGGVRCKATNFGSFVWSGVGNVDTTSETEWSFTVRAPSGVRFITTTNPANHLGVRIVSGGSSWSSLSDSNAKTEVKPVDPRAVLAKLHHLPVTEWEYKADPHRRYFGPMAQDFHAAFGLGRDNKTISTLDADGVLFLSVKGLVEELKDRDARIERLESELSEIRKQLSNLPPAP